MESEDLVSSLRLRRIATKLPHGAVSSSSSTDFGGQAAAAADAEEPVSPCGRMFSQPSMNCYIMHPGVQEPHQLARIQEDNGRNFGETQVIPQCHEEECERCRCLGGNRGDIDAHVFEPSGFSKEDFAAPHFVEKYVADLATAPSMIPSWPLWECHVLNGTSGHDAAAHMVLRMHHSLGDGTSLMTLLLASTRRVDQPDMLPSVPALKQKEQSNKAVPHSFLISLWKSFIVAWNTTIGVAYFFATILWLRDSNTKIKGHAGEGMAQKSLMFASIDIDDMRLVKEAIHGTINDVLMGIIGAGLHRYLESRYDDLGNPAGEPESRGEERNLEGVPQTHGSMQNGPFVVNRRKNTSKLDHLRVRATVLMNVRPSSGVQELASIMDGGSQSQWGNQLGSLIFPIPLKYFSDPLDRIQAAKKTSDRMKASLEGAFTYSSRALLMSIQGQFCQQGLQSI